MDVELMKNKKGFAFIETLVVVAILTASLLMVYSTYNSAVIKENSRIRYDDSAYLYRTYYIYNFFQNYRMDLIASNLDSDNMITSFNCNNTNIFLNEEASLKTANIKMCESMLDNFHVSNIYLTYNDLGFLQDCTNTDGKCSVLLQVSQDAQSYMKTIGGNGKDGYRIIIEYAEKKDGSKCESATTCTDRTDTKCVNTSCRYFYTTLSLGAIE
jgi:Tfp pilus assembly protein PilE